MDYIKFLKYPIKTWLFSLLLASAIYSFYTINTPKPHNLIVDFFTGFLLYTLSMGFDSIILLLVYCIFYFVFVEYYIPIIWRKTFFITGVSLIAIYQSLTHERAFKFDMHGNYFFPYFESTMVAFWLIYGLSSILFILIIKDYKY